MAKQLQLRGGTTAQHALFTGAAREITIDTDAKVIVVHDGVTPGGFPVISDTLAQGHFNSVINPHSVTKAQVGLGSADNTADSAKNVLSATKLTTARTINGVSFDGSANINIEDRLGTPIASAATVTIGTSGLGDYLHITGTTTITSFGTAATAGIRRTLIFDEALTLTHNATSLICVGGVSIVTVAGMVIEVVAETTANWRVVSITHPSISATEMGYLDGVTSAIQTQLNAKLASTATATDATKWNGASMYTSTSVASGGVDGDIWFQY